MSEIRNGNQPIKKPSSPQPGNVDAQLKKIISNLAKPNNNHGFNLGTFPISGKPPKK